MASRGYPHPSSSPIGPVRGLNPRRVKVHRAYTVEEVAKLFQGHKNTVRDWLKSGLEKVDDRRPTLILGRQLAIFLHARRQRWRKRCRPGELYCFRCRTPRASAGNTAVYVPLTASLGSLKAVCADCGTCMYRRVSLRKLAAAAGELQVVIPKAQQRIEDNACPSLNSDFGQEPQTYANAQPGK